MSETFLEKILASTREKVAAQRGARDIDKLREQAFSARSVAESHRLMKAVSRPDTVNLIAEIKRASPSKGVINDRIDVEETARMYASGGACAISVLTEEQFFKGLIGDLKTVRDVVDVPILRKDFIVDEYQIYEAAAARADAVLLIVAALSDEDLEAFHRIAIDELGMDALVEVHTLSELEVAESVGAKLIGVNNRDLRTFNVSLNVSRELIKHRPPGALMIAESGISSREQIEELRSVGFDGFLVGESLMRAASGEKLVELVS